MRTRFAHNPLESLTGPLVQQSRLFEAEAEIRNLRRQLAAKNNTDDESPDEDELDEGDTESPGKPKGKKTKTKKGGDDVDKNEDEEEQPARPDEQDQEGPQEGDEDPKKLGPATPRPSPNGSHCLTMSEAAKQWPMPSCSRIGTLAASPSQKSRLHPNSE